MIYVKEKDRIKKYDIEIDKERLEGLKIKIINDCSIIKHVKQKVREDCKTNDYDFMHVRNYHARLINKISNNDFFGPPLISIYEEEYDFYEEPKIVGLIDEVINGKDKKVLELLEYKDEELDYESLEDKLKKLLSNRNEKNASKFIKEVEELAENFRNITYQKPVGTYLSDVKSCIKLILVDEISYQDYLRVHKFVDGDFKNEPLSMKKVKNCFSDK